MNLIDLPPYHQRDEKQFLKEAIALAVEHRQKIKQLERVWAQWDPAKTQSVQDLPYLHVSLFKHYDLKPDHNERRVLHSSATSGVGASKIFLEPKSSQIHTQSVVKILENFVGTQKTPLLILDASSSLLKNAHLTARTAAALSLQPLSSSVHFLLNDSTDTKSLKRDLLKKHLQENDFLRVYGFTWMLWQIWTELLHTDPEIKKLLKGKKIQFIHSGGWKRLESEKVTTAEFERILSHDLTSESLILDFYGLVEQVGIIYPMCSAGFRHFPVWADGLVRDPHHMKILNEEPGQLQLLNALPVSIPNVSVLTEDMARMVPGSCPCGRVGKRFELLGRVPQAEVRGCANVI